MSVQKHAAELGKKYRGASYNVQRVGAAALRGETEKAGEKSQERDDKDLQSHASDM